MSKMPFDSIISWRLVQLLRWIASEVLTRHTDELHTNNPAAAAASSSILWPPLNILSSKASHFTSLTDVYLM